MASRKRLTAPPAGLQGVASVTSRTSRTSLAASWTALLAATALGIQGAASVRAEVKAEGGALRDGESYRLVVQSYDGGEPSFGRAKPVGAAQRVVTGAELRRGVNVNVVELRQASLNAETPVVIAWLERESSDLEFEGLAARPTPGSVYGASLRGKDDGSVQIRLDRQI